MDWCGYLHWRELTVLTDCDTFARMAITSGHPNQGSRALRLRRLARPVAPPAQVQQVYHQVIASSRTRQQSAHPRTE